MSRAEHRTLGVVLDGAARRALATPGALLFSAGLYAAVVAVLASLWRTAAGANGGSVAGYSAAALTWYVCASEAATIPINNRLIETFADDVATGGFAVEMLRPASPLTVRVATEVGRSSVLLGVCVTVGALIATLLSGPPPNLASAMLAVPAIALAITINLVSQHAVGAVSFWLRDARSVWFVYQKIIFILGGMLLPLEVLPSALPTPAKFLPFMAMAYAPARLASGHFEPWLLLVQAGWLAVMAAIAIAAFDAGQRRILKVGA